MSLTCRRMSAASLEDAFVLLSTFLQEDPHYRASSRAYGDRGAEAVRMALRLFLERSDLGFVWLAYEGERAIGVCVITYAISTSVGSLVAKLDDMYVEPASRSSGVGDTLLRDLGTELRAEGLARIDTSVRVDNVAARRFYERFGFRSLGEERLALLL